MKISLKGYGENAATFKTANQIANGEPVAMVENFTVDTCKSGDNFIGCAVNSADGYSCVQLEGYAVFSYSGTAPETGVCTLAADGNGGVCVSGSGRQFIVTDVDTDKSTVGIIL